MKVSSPLKSADGLTDIYTRNGSFVLNEQFNVVNSSGQALLAAAVDSSGKADLEKAQSFGDSCFHIGPGHGNIRDSIGIEPAVRCRGH